jgi:serine/threonine protein kinase
MKPSNEIMAMKSMDKRSTVMKNQVQHVHSEKNVLAESDSGWIVSLHASFQDKHMLHLLMDFMPGGDLMELLIKYDIFTEAATKQYISELMVALKHVHTLGYIHRDIKPDNLLIDARGHIKLTDLGLCKKLGDIETEGIKPAEFNPDDDPDDEGAAPARKARHIPQAFSVVGTPDYIAPEVLLQEGYGAESDMWSMGVIMFECLLGYTPFHGDNPLTITRKIVNWRTVLRFPRSRIKNLSPECMHFMRSLICDAPDRLGKQGGIGEIQKHPWLAGVKWDSLREQPAPYKPVIADCWEELIDEIKPLPLDSPRFKEIVEKITSHFPDAGNHIAPALFQGKRQPQHKDQNFMGFEYRRKPKVQHALLDD